MIHNLAAPSGGGKRGSKGRGAFPLLAVALEGVRRFGHHISVDYFADLTVVLASLARRQALALPLRLQALATGVHISRSVEETPANLSVVTCNWPGARPSRCRCGCRSSQQACTSAGRWRLYCGRSVALPKTCTVLSV